MTTSISTLSISDLKFPNITVCPPKRSNTALNYDLMKAGNDPLTEEVRGKLLHKLYTIFVRAPFQEQWNRKSAEINTENFETLFKGYQTVPTVTDDNITETFFCSTSGTFHSPYFRGELEESFYESDQLHRVKLELPEHVKEFIGSGFLLIELEVDTRVEGGWNESVWVRNDTSATLTYKFHAEKKSWNDAETTCNSEGGHLASIENLDQQRLVAGVIHGGNSKSWFEETWIGRRAGGQLGRNSTCTAFQKMDNIFADYDCSYQYAFVCQAGQTKLSGRKSLRLTYTKEELTFSYFLVQYSYFPNKSRNVIPWKDKGMTGFKLSWEIQNPSPPMRLETDDVGSVITTPGIEKEYQSDFDEKDRIYEEDRLYEATLKVPQSLLEPTGNGSLVFELEVKLRDDQTDEVQISRGGAKIFSYHTEPKTWREAEDFCRSIGGNLASIESEEEFHSIKNYLSYTSATWLGGSFVGQTWQWSDGSRWNFTAWQAGIGNGGSGCVSAWGGNREDLWEDNDNDYFKKDSCGYFRHFICQTTPQTLTRSSNLRFNFKREKIPLSWFKVRYFSAALYQQRVQKRKEETTGFRLTWFVRDHNGKGVPSQNQVRKQDWKLMLSAPKYENPWIKRMVVLARQARLQQVSIEGLVEKALNNKKLSNSEADYCQHRRLKGKFPVQLFVDLERTVPGTTNSSSFQSEDFLNGAKIFFATIFCPNSLSLKLLGFFQRMIKSQSPRSLIKIVVDTIQSGDIDNRESKKSVNQLYLALEKEFDLQYGRVLLALSSKEELEEMLSKRWPFFVKYSQELALCLNGTTCGSLNDIIANLGEIFNDRSIFFLPLSRSIVKRPS